jgi:hypothetical protein
MPTNPDRDKAKNAFTPESVFEDLAAAMDAPITVEDGDDAVGYNIVGVSTNSLSEITSYSVYIYIWDGDVWKLMEQNNDVTGPFNETYFIAPWNRFYVRILNISGGGSPSMRLRRNYTV